MVSAIKIFKTIYKSRYNLFNNLTQVHSSKVETFHCCNTEAAAVGKNELNSVAKTLVKEFRLEAMAKTSCKPSKSCSVNFPAGSLCCTMQCKRDHLKSKITCKIMKILEALES